MGLFSKKEKNFEPKGKPLDFDPLNVQIGDLRPGFFVDYNFKTYEITGGFEYSLKEYSFKALKFDAADHVMWVVIQNAMDTFLAENVSLTAVNPELQTLMANFGKPLSTVRFNEADFAISAQGDGKFRDLSKNAMDWNRLACWKYASGDGTLLFALQKGQNTFEALLAKPVNAGEFSNFLPKI